MSNVMEVCSNYFTLPFIFHERIDNMDYPSNANMSSDQSKQTVHVTSAIKSTPKEKSAKANGIKGFLLQQDFRDIKDVINDIVRPLIRAWIYSFIEDTLNAIGSSFQMMIFGDVRYKTNSRVGDKVSYNNYSKSKTANLAPSISSSVISDSINYESRGDAEAVLESMRRQLEEYQVVTVSQMYEFSNLKPPNWTTTTYGWTDLTDARIRRDYDGDYFIDLPRAKPIGR